MEFEKILLKKDLLILQRKVIELGESPWFKKTCAKGKFYEIKLIKSKLIFCRLSFDSCCERVAERLPDSSRISSSALSLRQRIICQYYLPIYQYFISWIFPTPGYSADMHRICFILCYYAARLIEVTEKEASTIHVTLKYNSFVE